MLHQTEIRVSASVTVSDETLLRQMCRTMVEKIPFEELQKVFSMAVINPVFIPEEEWTTEHYMLDKLEERKYHVYVHTVDEFKQR
jgi:hypothetical protein